MHHVLLGELVPHAFLTELGTYPVAEADTDSPTKLVMVVEPS